VPSPPCVAVGVCLADGSGPSAEADRLATELQAALTASHPRTRWAVTAVPGGRPAPAAPVPAPALLGLGRAVLLEHDLDIVVMVTSRPMQLGGRPVAAHASPVQQTIAISEPGLRPGEPVVTAAARLVPGLLETEAPDADSARVLDELAQEGAHDRHGLAFTVRTLTASPRLLLRMVLANRPWLLAVRLSRTLVGAFTAAVIAIVTPDVWTLADRMGPVRLTAIAALSLAATCAVLVIGGGLREHAPSRRVRRTVLLHNAAVWISVALGVLALYAGLVVVGMATTLLVLPWGLVAQTVGHPVGWGTMLRVGTLASVVALVGSAFGAGLEDDAVVQQATYTGSDDAEYVGT
jgi:uncharacterized membrane protein